MPLYHTIKVNATTQVLIWKLTETERELSTGILLNERSQIRLSGMKSETHRRGFLSIRHLLKYLGYSDQDLIYNESGKPHLCDGKHISITHSHNFTGIVVSDDIEVGIDIEMQREKILRIAHKFTPIEEYRTLANTDALIRKLTMVWGAKESLYKIYATQGLSFLQHIDVLDFTLGTDEVTNAIITYKGYVSQYRVWFYEFEGFTLAYALSK